MSTNHDSTRSPAAQRVLLKSLTIFDDRVRRRHALRAARNQWMRSKTSVERERMMMPDDVARRVVLSQYLQPKSIIDDEHRQTDDAADDARDSSHVRSATVLSGARLPSLVIASLDETTSFAEWKLGNISCCQAPVICAPTSTGCTP